MEVMSSPDHAALLKALNQSMNLGTDDSFKKRQRLTPVSSTTQPPSECRRRAVASCDAASV